MGREIATAGRFLMALYLGHSNIASSYGAAGSLVALFIWIYYSCAILFYGAEFVRAHHLGHCQPVETKKMAVLGRKHVIKHRPKPDNARR